MRVTRRRCCALIADPPGAWSSRCCAATMASEANAIVSRRKSQPNPGDRSVAIAIGRSAPARPQEQSWRAQSADAPDWAEAQTSRRGRRPDRDDRNVAEAIVGFISGSKMNAIVRDGEFPLRNSLETKFIDPRGCPPDRSVR